MKKYILFFIVLSIFFLNNNVYAYENYDTSFNLTYDDLSDVSYCDSNVEDYINSILDYFHSLNNENYNVVVGYSQDYYQTIRFNFISKNHQYANINMYGLYSSNHYYFLQDSTLDYNDSQYEQFDLVMYLDNSRCNKTKFLDSDVVKSCFNQALNNPSNPIVSCMDSSSVSNGSDLVLTSSYGSDFDVPSLSVSTITNNNSYNYNLSKFLIYSDIPIFLNSNVENNENRYYKSIYINGSLVNNGDMLPLYIQNDDVSNFNIEKMPSYSIGGISPNDISSFKLDITANFSDSNYIQSLRPYIYYFGRIDNSTYYSYKRLSCDGSAFSLALDDESANLTILPYGFTCSDDLSNIDNIYIHIDFDYDVNTNSYLHNLQSKVSNGYFSINNHGRYIYEKFDNLSYDSSFLISTFSDSTELWYSSNNSNTLLVPIDYNNNIQRYALDNLQFGKIYNRNALIYNYPSNDRPNVNIDLFINDNVIVSLSDDNNYSYYDSNGNITSSYIENDVIINFNKNYDTSYYKNIVSNFIDSLSDDIYSFSILTQNFYDSLPQILQDFIFVIFILFCFYFIYLLIKR